MSYDTIVKYIEWDVEKNEYLKRERGVSFENAIEAIVGVGLIIILDHPNRQKYAHQKMYIVELNDYAYMVPCVEDEEKIFLKTIIPSRKYTKRYIEKGDI